MRAHLSTVILSLVIAIVGLNLAAKAAAKPFWFDELLTLNVARYPAGPPLWRAMTAGFEFNPPGIYVATRFSEKLFGRGPVSSRLPVLIAGLFVLLCMYRVAAWGSGPETGFWAIFFLAFSGVTAYFYEARGYALVLAGTMLAWISWQSISGESARRRWIALAGVWAGLFIALASHMWAIVIPGCFMAGEMTRWLRTRTRDTAMLSAMVFPLAVAFSYPPLVAITKGIHFGSWIYHDSLYSAYKQTFDRLPVLAMACAFALVVGWLFDKETTGMPARPKRMRTEDAVLALSLAAAPVAIWAVTRISGTPFVIRYSLIAGLGVSFLLAQLPLAFAGRARQASAALLFAVGMALMGVSIRAIVTNPPWRTQHPWADKLEKLAMATAGGGPIVFSNCADFLEADYYADPKLAKRFVCVADRNLAIQFTHTDGADMVFVLGRDYLALKGRIISYSQLRRLGGGFWLAGASNEVYQEVSWIGPSLRKDIPDMHVRAVPGTRLSYVSFSDPK